MEEEWSYWKLAKRVFIEHKDHYEVVDVGAQEVVQQMQQHYTVHEWSRYGKFAKSGAIADAYVVRKGKMKNINKFRPIVDASRHPLEGALKVLMFVMQSVWLQTCHLTLHNKHLRCGNLSHLYEIDQLYTPNPRFA